MNSKQRRKDRREWKYSVAINLPEGIRTWEYYMDIWDWCTSQWGRDIDKCGWRESGDSRAIWQFNCPKKATAFALKWAS